VVHCLVQQHKGYASFSFVVEQGSSNRGWPAVQGQQGWVNIQNAVREQLQYTWGDDVAVGDEHSYRSVQGLEHWQYLRT
jgi:hypothetical protein